MLKTRVLWAVIGAAAATLFSTPARQFCEGVAGGVGPFLGI